MRVLQGFAYSSAVETHCRTSDEIQRTLAPEAAHRPSEPNRFSAAAPIHHAALNYN